MNIIHHIIGSISMIRTTRLSEQDILFLLVKNQLNRIGTFGAHFLCLFLSRVLIFVMIFFKKNLGAQLFAGKLYRVGRNAARMGCDLVHNCWTLERTILSETHHSFHCSNPLSQRCDSKQLVSQSHLHLSPQLLLIK